jgi:hypothetical protein
MPTLTVVQVPGHLARLCSGSLDGRIALDGAIWIGAVIRDAVDMLANEFGGLGGVGHGRSVARDRRTARNSSPT